MHLAQFNRGNQFHIIRIDGIQIKAMITTKIIDRIIRIIIIIIVIARANIALGETR